MPRSANRFRPLRGANPAGALALLSLRHRESPPREDETSRYEIQIPYIDPDQPIGPGEAHNLAREAGLDPESRSTLIGLVMDEAINGDGTPTAGELVDRIESASPDERREIVSRAREQVGLEPLERVEFAERFAALQRGLQGLKHRDENGRAVLKCSAPGCEAFPTNANGSPRPVKSRKWWCGTHKDQAGPEDHLPPDDLMPRLNRWGGLRPRREVEERMIAEEQRRREARRKRDAELRADRERLERVEQRWRDETPGPPVAGGRLRRSR